MSHSDQFTEWLLALGSRRRDMPTIDRGFAVQHTITYPGDVTTATLAGAIKIAPDSTTETAVWTVGTPSFSDGLTSWSVSLSRAQTLLFDTSDAGFQTFVYDFALTLSGQEPRRIMGGLVPVAGFVTEIA